MRERFYGFAQRLPTALQTLLPVADLRRVVQAERFRPESDNIPRRLMHGVKRTL